MVRLIWFRFSGRALRSAAARLRQTAANPRTPGPGLCFCRPQCSVSQRTDVCHCPGPCQAAPSPRPPAPSEFGLRGWRGSAPPICTHCVGGTVSPSTRHSPSPGWDCVRRQGLSRGDELTEATRVLVRRGDEGPDARSRPHEDAGSRRVSTRGASRRRGPACTPGPPPSAFGATGKVSFKTPLHSEFQRDVVESAIGLFQDVSRLFGCVESFSAVVTSVSKLQAPPHSLFPEQVPHNHACAPNPSAPRRGTGPARGPQEGRAGVARRVWAKGTKVPNGMREGGGGDPGRRCGDPDEMGRTDTETSREGGTGAFTSLSRVKWKLQLWGNTWEPRRKVPGVAVTFCASPSSEASPRVSDRRARAAFRGFRRRLHQRPRTAGPSRLQLVADAPGSLALEARGEPGSPGFKSLTTENRCLHL